MGGVYHQRESKIISDEVLVRNNNRPFPRNCWTCVCMHHCHNFWSTTDILARWQYLTSAAWTCCLLNDCVNFQANIARLIVNKTWHEESHLRNSEAHVQLLQGIIKRQWSHNVYIMLSTFYERKCRIECKSVNVFSQLYFFKLLLYIYIYK